MIRTLNVAENNLYADAATPVTVPAATATDVLPDEVGKVTGEIAYRYIQNVGVNPLYYAIGQDCSTINYNGILAPDVTNGQGGQLDCSNHRMRISVYSVGGTIVAKTIIRRNNGRS